MRKSNSPIQDRKKEEVEEVANSNSAESDGDGDFLVVDEQDPSVFQKDEHSVQESRSRSNTSPEILAIQKEKWDRQRGKGNAEFAQPSASSSPKGDTSLVIDSLISKLKQHYMAYTGVLAVVILAVVLTLVGSPKTDANGNVTGKESINSVGIGWERGQLQFKQYVKSIKQNYPSQSFETISRIFSAVTSTMTPEEPRQPSAVVLLTPPEVDSGFTPCFAREVARNVHSVFHNITGLQYTQKILEIGPDYLNSAESITDIHDKLKTYLNNGKVVIVNNVQQVNRADQLLVFHAFCDNTAAPEKRATFLFIVPVPSQIYNKFKWEDEYGAEISQEVLLSSWTSLSLDKRPALIARVAANIIMVKPGDRCVSV